MGSSFTFGHALDLWEVVEVWDVRHVGDIEMERKVAVICVCLSNEHHKEEVPALTLFVLLLLLLAVAVTWILRCAGYDEDKEEPRDLM